MPVDCDTSFSSIVNERRMLLKDNKYPINDDGMIMTPKELYRRQRAETDGFDVDKVPSQWLFVGQITPIDIHNFPDPKYEEFVKYAIDCQNRKPKKGKKKIEFVELLKAMVQLVAGRNYYLTFTVRNVAGKNKKTNKAASLKTRICQAIVYRRWDGFLKLTLFRNAKAQGASSYSNGEPLASDLKDGTSLTTDSDSKTISSSALSEHLHPEQASSSRKRKQIDDEDLDSHLRIDWFTGRQFSSGNKLDDKPVSVCSLSKDGKMIATCNSSSFGLVDGVPKLKGHKKSLTDVAFSPSEVHIATASVDKTAKLWKPKKNGWSCVKTFKGHKNDLARLAFHPSGHLLGTTSLDNTWRLWDIDMGLELLQVAGHDCRRIAFNYDGSLAASSSIDDAVVRCWDLQSGKGVVDFVGHKEQILGISFSPNGYHLATGGKNNVLQIWDLRMGRSLSSIVAHSDIISEVKFTPEHGSYLFTGSHDATVKVWSSRDFGLVRSLTYQKVEVTAFDVLQDGEIAATVHHQTVSMWSAAKY